MSETKAQYGEVKAVEIRAEVRNMKTMADHSINLVLNIPEDCLPQAKVLLGWIGCEVKAVIETC
jgi:hypothetical protein